MFIRLTKKMNTLDLALRSQLLIKPGGSLIIIVCFSLIYAILMFFVSYNKPRPSYNMSGSIILRNVSSCPKTSRPPWLVIINGSFLETFRSGLQRWWGPAPLICSELLLGLWHCIFSFECVFFFIFILL